MKRKWQLVFETKTYSVFPPKATWTAIFPESPALSLFAYRLTCSPKDIVGWRGAIIYNEFIPANLLELDNCVAESDYKGSGGPAGKNTPGIAEYAKKSLAVPVLRMVLLSSIPRIYRLAYNRLYDFFYIYSS